MSSAESAKSALTARKDSGERHELAEIVVGKDVLELVSSAMYVDPMTVYREYIQNAADAADEARVAGLLEPETLGLVDISVDLTARAVIIRDNGCGIPFNEFGRRISALGGSVKRGTPARGFRGVGRLAGLAYAQELVFRSRASGESRVSVLRWDCRRLKAALREADKDTGVADLIKDVTILERVDDSDAPEHFFEVQMNGIVRLRNDRLMNPAAISEYLSQVAPVPFSPEFRFGPDILKALSKHIELSPLEIRINGADATVYRPHSDSFDLDDKGKINFDKLNLIEIPGIDGGVAAVGWVLHHEYDGAIPASTMVKGLRLRAGNIQVGDHALLEDLFPEPRFNVWSVGEVHVIDRRIVPNGRRDQFEQNGHFHNLLNHLSPVARDIARRCRTSSLRRKWDREFEVHKRAAVETVATIAQGSVGKAERERLALSAEQTFVKMDKVAGTKLLIDSVEQRSAEIADLRVRLKSLMKDGADATSPLTRLPEEKRRAYEQFFELVYACSTNRVTAKALIDRIMQRLS